MVIKKAPKRTVMVIDGERIVHPPYNEPRPAAKIMEGLQEALAVAKGEAEPHAWHARQPKKLQTLRLDVDVIDKFKATGPGWQGRMNEVLKNAKV